ncbi:hypothetical protein G6F56_014123 [Rhizopus delemar]|nr:hypothetical protein G6F56_014123 [Rhizopus delemar]
MDIVAEGVETAAQRAYLERLGCDYLQGSLLGRPVDAARFMQLHDLPRPRVELAQSPPTQHPPGCPSWLAPEPVTEQFLHAPRHPLPQCP